MRGTLAGVSMLVLATSAPAVAGPWAIDRAACTNCAEGEEAAADPLPAPAPPQRNVWKPVFVAAVVVELGVIGFGVYSMTRMNDEAEQIQAVTSQGLVSSDDCGTTQEIRNDIGGHFANACKWHRRMEVDMFLGLGVGAFVAVSAYMAFRKQPRPDAIAITPAVTREMAGAQLSLTW